MFKGLFIVIVILCFNVHCDGKSLKKNLDPLRKLKKTNPDCDPETFFPSSKDFDLFTEDLTEHCPSSLSASSLPDESKEKSLILCPIIFIELNRSCSFNKDDQPKLKSYDGSSSKGSLCGSKYIPSINEWIFKSYKLPEENTLNVDEKNLCDKITDSETIRLVRFIYKLGSLLMKRDLSNTKQSDSAAKPEEKSPTEKSESNQVVTKAPEIPSNGNPSITTTLTDVKVNTTETVSNGNSTTMVVPTNTTKTNENVQTNVTLVNPTTITTTQSNSSSTTTKDQTNNVLDVKQTENKEQQSEKKEEDKEDEDETKAQPDKTEQKQQIDEAKVEPEKKEPEQQKPKDDKDDDEDEDEEDRDREKPTETKTEEKPKDEQKEKGDENKEENDDDEEGKGDDEDYPAARVDEDVEQNDEGTNNDANEPVGGTDQEINDDNREKEQHHIEANAEHIEANEPKDESSDKHSGKHHHPRPEKIVDPPTKTSDRKSSGSKSDVDQGSSGSFVTYFLLFTLFVVVGYLILHNKNKLMGYIVEGRRANSSRTGSRPSHRHYELIQNVNDVIDTDQTQFSPNK